MAKVTIGGTVYEVPEMNFAALERSWPFVDKAMFSLDPMQGPSAGISIIAAGLMEADWFKPSEFGIKPEEMLGEEQVFERVTKFLKKKLKARELEQVRQAVNKICEEAGLEEAKPGEPQPLLGAEKNGSTETAPNTSTSSPPQAAVEGTEDSSGNDTASETTPT